MSHGEWIGSTDGDFDTAANWLSGAVPVNGDSWQADDRSERPIDTNLDQSAKTFTRISFQGMKYPIGNSAADPLKCAVTSLYAHGSESRSIFMKGAITNVFASLLGNTPDGLVLDGAITFMSITAGKIRVIGTNTQPANSIWEVGGDGFDEAQLTIETGADLVTNNTVLVAQEGTIDCWVDADDVRIGNGRFIIGETDAATPVGADMLIVAQFGGELWWRGRGSIVTQYHGFGGRFYSDRDLDYPRTLTDATVWSGGHLDMATAINTTFTNAVKKFGGQVTSPAGFSITLAA